jgi:hypothetical protein
MRLLDKVMDACFNILPSICLIVALWIVYSVPASIIASTARNFDEEDPQTLYEIAAVQYVEEAGIPDYIYYCVEASSMYAQCDFTLYQNDFVSFLSLTCHMNEDEVYCILK